MAKTNDISAFANDVRAGLTAAEKYLPSKYFYDDRGSEIFTQIMAMDSYYPTSCEFEILSTQAADILKELEFKGAFNIVEFGSGDGTKTVELLKTFTQRKATFTYIPIDISEDALLNLQANIKTVLPELDIRPMAGDYFTLLPDLSKMGQPTLYLFLGGNIGNYDADQARELLGQFRDNMNHGDKLLVGIDLKKDPRIIQKAYDDEHGITKEFNLNLLARINRELEADIDISKFEFYPHYDPRSGHVESYIYSIAAQNFYSKVLDQQFHFSKNELIHTEISKKYDLNEIAALAEELELNVIKNFTDRRGYFSDSLWSR